MANLIICCDGTWNTPDQEDNGQPAPTNVFKLHGALADVDDQDVKQTAYYRNGVGTTGNVLKRMLGGSLGVGLSNDIKSAYKWLCDHYVHGDTKIYLFGFSRGAFSVRSLAGLVGRCGVLIHDSAVSEAQRWNNVKKVYDIYRGPDDDGQRKISSFDVHKDVGIEFLGVWDTVGALGIPDELPLNIFDRPERFRFHNTILGNNVKCARHAVAMDEQRQTFSPTLWSQFDADRVKQVWFPGVHGDVGGSYADHGLGDAALQWMITEAQNAGLAFKSNALAQIVPNHQATLHNSVRGVFAKLRTRPRAVPRIDDDSIHDIGRERFAAPPLEQPDYWPTKVLATDERWSGDVFASPHWNTTGLFLEAGRTYHFRATGEWLDASIRCTPEGPIERLGVGQTLQKVTLVPEVLQRWKRSKAGQEGALVSGSRREQDLPYFCLVGVIANGIGVDEKTQTLHPHETFKIGASAKHTPEMSGYLYCFANDVWSFYGNNKGGIRLEVF